MKPELHQALKSRIDAAKQHKDCGRYIKYGKAGIEEVTCKCCGDPVRTMVPDDRYQEVREIKGKKVICERLVLMCLPAYTEIMIEFDDGSAHATVICSCCAEKLDLKEVEWLYTMDLQEWMLEPNNLSDNFWEQQVRRKPISFKVFPPGTVAT